MNNKVLKYRVLLDDDGNVFRDIELKASHTYENLHQAIVKAFGFRGDQMTSFYKSNDNWEKGQEITLMPMEMDLQSDQTLLMKDCNLGKHFGKKGNKTVYVYDFLKMWCFFVECIEEKTEEPNAEYPRTVLEFGEAPNEGIREMDDDEDLNEEEDESEISRKRNVEDEVEDIFGELGNNYDDVKEGDDYY